MSSAPTSVTLQSGERISNIVRYHSVRAAVGVGWNKVRNKFERDQAGSVQQFNITNSRSVQSAGYSRFEPAGIPTSIASSFYSSHSVN